MAKKKKKRPSWMSFDESRKPVVKEKADESRDTVLNIRLPKSLTEFMNWLRYIEPLLVAVKYILAWCSL